MRKTNGFAAIAAVTLFAVGLTGCDRTPKQEVSATVQSTAQPTAAPTKTPRPTPIPPPSPVPAPDYGPMPEYDYVIPFTQEDWEVPSPGFLTEEQEILYKQAYKFYGIYDYVPY